MVRHGTGDTWSILTSMCLPFPASAWHFSIIQPQLYDFGDCISKTLDFKPEITALDASAACQEDHTSLSHLSGVLEHVKRCHPYRLTLMLLPRWKSRGVIARPPYKFDLLTILPSWAALCFTLECCVANFHGGAPEMLLMLKISVDLRLAR